MGWRSQRVRGGGPRRSGTVRSSTFLSRLFFLAGLASALALLIGFVRFGDHVTGLRPPSDPTPAEGAVVLTGASDLRLKTGVALLEAGRFPLLLISGVNRMATKDDIRHVSGGNARLFACCVELGKSAIDTVGNAAETKQWVKVHGVGRLLVITDSFHMPRALLEMRRALPGVTLIAYPVNTNVELGQAWWQNERATRALALEYGKYLVALGRGFMAGDMSGLGLVARIAQEDVKT